MPNHVQPKNLHQAITIGLERAIRDFGVDLTDCTPSTLTGHVIRELKRIPGWRPPARLIKTPEELDALQPAADIIRAWDEDQTIVVPALIRCDDNFVFERATTPLPIASTSNSVAAATRTTSAMASARTPCRKTRLFCAPSPRSGPPTPITATSGPNRRTDRCPNLLTDSNSSSRRYRFSAICRRETGHRAVARRHRRGKTSETRADTDTSKSLRRS